MNSLVRIATVALSLCVSGGLAVGVAHATDEPDQLITGKKLLIKHKTDTSKNKIVFLSKDPSIVLPGAGNDPTQGGATLQVIDLGNEASTTLVLDSSRCARFPTASSTRARPATRARPSSSNKAR
jgi:hypothetical protein